MNNRKSCPYCNSNNTKKAGTLKNGTQRYKCKNCNKGFSEHTIIKESDTVTCPKCNETAIKCGKTRLSKQRYFCRKCNYKFVENPQQQSDKYTKHNKICPVCGYKWAKKAGKLKDKQYYICNSCGHKYLEGGTQQYTTQKQKEEIVELIKQDTPIKQIAKQYNIHEKTIRNVCTGSKGFKEWRLKTIITHNIMKGKSITDLSDKYNVSPNIIQKWIEPLYKTETLTNQQKQLIYKFGVQLAIPTEYLAEYVPCSRHICNKFLSNFKIKPPKRIERTKVEKYWDDMLLNKFLA